jgi:hypothetical protein
VALPLYSRTRNGVYRATETGVSRAMTGSADPITTEPASPSYSQKIRGSASIEERLVILVRRPMFGSPPITGAVGPEPPKPSVAGALNLPPVLMDEPMVEATDEQKVVQVGGASP